MPYSVNHNCFDVWNHPFICIAGNAFAYMQEYLSLHSEKQRVKNYLILPHLFLMVALAKQLISVFEAFFYHSKRRSNFDYFFFFFSHIV